MEMLKVNKKELNLRNEPGRDVNIIGVNKRGEILKVLRFYNQYYWVQIQRENYRIGFSAYKYFLGVPDKKFRPNDYRWLKKAYGGLETPELTYLKENYWIMQYQNTCELSLDNVKENSEETPRCSAFAKWRFKSAGHQGVHFA